MSDKVERDESAPEEPRSSDTDQAAAPDPPDADGNGTPSSGNAQTYEQARDELIEVVRRLENGGTTLEESLRLWERGEELARICQAWLDGARARLERATGRTESGEER